MQRPGEFAIILTLFSLCLLSCSKPQERDLPPGPEESAKNLLLYDSFVDRTERGALTAAWERAINPQTKVRTMTIGLMPLLLLTESDMSFWRSHLKSEEQVRMIRAVSDKSIQARGTAIPEALELLGKIRVIYMNLDAQPMSVFIEGEENLRREAWTRNAQPARRLAPLLQDLRTVRNNWSIQEGNPSFIEFLGAHLGYDPATLSAMQAEVMRALKRPGAETVSPWNLEAQNTELTVRFRKYLDQNNLLARGRQFLQRLDLPENPPQLTVRTLEKNEFSIYGTFPIDPPNDVRMTLASESGIAGYWRTLHEFGHAAQALLAPASGPFTMRRTVCSAVSEGCAKVAERLVYAPEWLRLQNVPDSELDQLKIWERASEQARMRQILADIEFEKVFYEQSEEDPQSQFVSIQWEVAGVKQPSDAPYWALQRQLAFKTRERANYLLARCAQAAIYRRLRNTPSGLLGKESARILKEDVFAYAAGRRFEEWFQRAAGTPPNCRAWIEDVAGVSLQKESQ